MPCGSDVFYSPNTDFSRQHTSLRQPQHPLLPHLTTHDIVPKVLAARLPALDGRTTAGSSPGSGGKVKSNTNKANGPEITVNTSSWRIITLQHTCPRRPSLSPAPTHPRSLPSPTTTPPSTRGNCSYHKSRKVASTIDHQGPSC